MRRMMDHINMRGWFFCMLLIIPSFFTDGMILIDNKNVSAMEIIFTYSYFIPNIARIEVIEMQFSDWYYFVMPIIMCSPTVILFIDSIRSKNYQFYLIRENMKSFFFSTSVAFVVSALLMLCCSTLIFISFVSIIFPHQSAYGEVWMALDSSQYVNYAWKFFHELFYILLIVSVSYFFSVVFVNRYVVITMAFLVNYLLYRYMEDVGIVFLSITAIILFFLSYRLLIRRCLNQ